MEQSPMYKPNSRVRICIYDGITIFVKDPNFVKYLLDNPEKYNIQLMTDATTGYRLSFRGRYKNFTINFAANKRGTGVVLGGSLHKWKNGNHNHDIFLWDEFLAVYQSLLSEFKFDPSQTDLWSLEGGLNNFLSDQFPVKKVLENTLLLKGDSRKESRSKFANEGYCLEVLKGECRHKFYDKGAQYRLSYNVLRTECNCKRRPLAKSGLITFADLVHHDNHTAFGKHLLKAFDTLLIYQPEILQSSELPESDRSFLLQHNNTNTWTSLQKSDYHQFKQSRKRYFSLVDNYCEVNYRTAILESMQLQLS